MADVSRSEVIGGLDQVVAAACDQPLFLFLDPCGLGIPFSLLTRTLTGPRLAKWPPTEVLLTLSRMEVGPLRGPTPAPAAPQVQLAGAVAHAGRDDRNVLIIGQDQLLADRTCAWVR
jgi:hypothetical protein